MVWSGCYDAGLERVDLSLPIMVATLPGCSTRFALACLVTALLIPERVLGATRRIGISLAIG
jgi:hypothetical protein